jgi:hypothetical protein
MSTNPNARLTKKGLLELIEKYPDDTPITVDGGAAIVNGIASGSLLGWDRHKAVVWAVSDNTDTINLEL